MKQHKSTPWLLMAPLLLGVVIFFLIPFGITLYYSFTVGVTGQFAGLENYAEVLSSSAFRLAAKNTLYFLAAGIPLNLLISFSLALLVRRNFWGSRLFRSVMLLPMVAGVCSVVIIVWQLFGDTGMLNTLLGRTIPWMEGHSAFWILEGVYLWKNCGYSIVLFLAGLNMIPKDFYDLAALEGASSGQMLRRITLPVMLPSIFFVFVISVINAFRTYREAFLLAGDYPDESIYMLQHFLTNNFKNLNYQRLTVAAVCVSGLIALLTAVLYRYQKLYEESEG